MRELRPVPITAEIFSPYGSILDRSVAKSYSINDGFATRYDRLAIADIVGGDAQIALFSACRRDYPLEITMMERHPFGSQAFFPLPPSGGGSGVDCGGEVWYAIVSCSAEPHADNLAIFSISGGVGIQYHRNIWHYPLLIESREQDFIVVDYCGTESNLDIYDMERGLFFVP